MVGPGFTEPGTLCERAEVARDQRVRIPARARAELGGRRRHLDVEDAEQLRVVADERAAVGGPGEAHLALAAAQAQLDSLVLVAGGVDGDGLARARLRGRVGARHRRDDPDGGLRRRRPDEQQHGGEGDDGEAGGREAARPDGECACARRCLFRLGAGLKARWRAAKRILRCMVSPGTVPAINRIGGNEAELRGSRRTSRCRTRRHSTGHTEPVPAASARHAEPNDGLRYGQQERGRSHARLRPRSACSIWARATGQILEKYLRTSQSVTCSRYSYHSLSLLVTKRSNTWSPRMRRTSSLSCVYWIAS